MPPCEDTAEPPRLRFKRAPSDSRYSTQQRYDPYFYQQREGGGPTRAERPLPPPVSTRGEVKQYNGPRKYQSPGGRKRNDIEPVSLGLENSEPLSFPGDLPPKKGFLGSNPVLPKSPGVDLDSAEAENTPKGLNKRRKSARYEPY